jgi:hypothetical protein
MLFDRTRKPPKKARGRKGVNPYAVCEASTGQSYATGKTLPWSSQNRKRTRKPPKKKSR